MARTEEKHEPIRQSVRVDCPVEDAFRLFTQGFPEWWPLASHSIAGDQARDCAIEPWEGGRLLERTRSGEELEWGTITVWEPPRRLEFTWHPADDRDAGQRVTVAFGSEAGGTRVVLTHHNWNAAAPVSALRCFAKFVLERMEVMA